MDILITHQDDDIVKGLLANLVARLEKLVSRSSNRIGLISAALSSPVFVPPLVPSGMSMGSFSRTAAGNRA